jgi:hypothetical protein
MWPGSPPKKYKKNDDVVRIYDSRGFPHYHYTSNFLGNLNWEDDEHYEFQSRFGTYLQTNSSEILIVQENHAGREFNKHLI